MAKGNPNGAAVQYKVHLKPNDIGLLVMERLERPHSDKSVELRRLIELGYACDRAGFSLDGTVLRHAGRTWETQPNLSSQPQTEAYSTAAELPAAPQRSRAPRRPESEQEAGRPAAPQADPIAPAETMADAPAATPSLKNRLRGLSG
jgi:hypothetical protein